MEHTAGHLTKGEYKVKLPDGRVQVVSYEADHAGFRPRISYESAGLVVESSQTGHHGQQHLHDQHHGQQQLHDQYHVKPVKKTKPKKYHPVVKIPYKRPEELYSQTENSHLPILPTPLPKTHPHPAPSYQQPQHHHPTSTTTTPPSPIPHHSPSPTPYNSPTPTPYHSPTPTPPHGPTPGIHGPTPHPISPTY